jgi:hypothetical protein
MKFQFEIDTSGVPRKQLTSLFKVIEWVHQIELRVAPGGR